MNPSQTSKMQFQEQQITVKAVDGEISIPAMVGIGSGLAYHHFDNDPDSDFVLVHIASGIGLASDWYSWDEKDAQRWLEKVAKLIDWTKRLKSVKQTIQRKGGMDVMRCLVTQALREAFNEGMQEDIVTSNPEDNDVVLNAFRDETLHIKTIKD